jgi:hypothetical protein
MPRLCSGNEIHAARIESRGLGCAIDARELWITGKKVFARAAHVRIWFKSENSVAVFKQQSREDSRTGSDIGDYRILS